MGAVIARARKVLREVLPDQRGGRGRWWRPNGNGYTDDLAEAGVFDSVAAGAGMSETWRQVDAEATIRGELAAVEERANRLALLLEEATR